MKRQTWMEAWTDGRTGGRTDVSAWTWVDGRMGLDGSELWMDGRPDERIDRDGWMHGWAGGSGWTWTDRHARMDRRMHGPWTQRLLDCNK